MKKLKQVADALNISKMTLWNWMKAGKIKFHKIGSMNYIDDETFNSLLGRTERKSEKVVIYARVSSIENKTNLETQKERLINYCNAKGYQVSKVVTEFGSGLNDARPKLEKLLKDQDFTRLVIEHKDRLTRFGFKYLEILLKRNGIEIEVVNCVQDEKEDLIQDFVSIITSFSSKIYGQRRSKRKTEQLIKELEIKESINNKNQ
jgi:excisionase family DNA binding protein